MTERYGRIRPGHWHQTTRTGPGPTYSTEYMSYYDRIRSTDMSAIRYKLIEDYIGDVKSVCDFGYGNGSFLEYCSNIGVEKTYGYDVSDYPVPYGSNRVNSVDEIDVDVVTFFDSIEHIEDPNLDDFLSNLKTKHVVISVPWFHEHLALWFVGPEMTDLQSPWFKSWKHRKPNEHFHHFDVHGLVGLLDAAGFTVVHVGNEEDQIRKPVDQHPNILTVVASRL